jgi:hypothetical protein
MVKTRQISHLHLQLNENSLTNYVMIGTETTNITIQEKKLYFNSEIYTLFLIALKYNRALTR